MLRAQAKRSGAGTGCRRIRERGATDCAELAELWAALPAWLDHAAIGRIRRQIRCRCVVQIPARVAPVIRAQRVEDGPELVGGVVGCGGSQRCARPQHDPGANQRDADGNE